MRILGFMLAALGTAAIIGYAFQFSEERRAHQPPVFSEQRTLEALWRAYKLSYVEQDTGRTVDRQHGDRTTSEGQSYTMLRATWMDDQETFEKAWKWTKPNMQQNNGLFGWLWGQKSDGGYGLLISEGGVNSASDADTDIALALLFGYSRWKDPAYVEEAKKIIQAIWDNEVVIINGKSYMASNNVEKTAGAEPIVLNPSYFSPYAYRIFQNIDPVHPWNDLVETSYQVLNVSLSNKLDLPVSAGLPPDWVAINRQTGALQPVARNNLKTDFSYDALRVPWRLALDLKWFNDDRARQTLSRMTFLSQEWNGKGRLVAIYKHDGQPAADFESPALYGGALGYFIVIKPKDAKEIYETKLLPLFQPDTDSWKQPLSYYDDNWAWFGFALYYDLLPDLAPSLTG